MKKKLIGLSLILMLIAIIANSSLAYFSDEEIATNVITAGNIKIELNEMMEDEQGNLIPYQNEMMMMPNTTVSKIVSVKNIGNQDAYIRLEVLKSINVDNADLDLIQIQYNQQDWMYQDGYYYYRFALKPQEETSPLFNEVYFDASMSNEYQNSVATIEIIAYSVQAKNNGSHVLEASGWPSKGGNES